MRIEQVVAAVEWWDGDTRHTETVQAHASVDPGDAVNLWIDADGARVLALTQRRAGRPLPRLVGRLR